MDLDRNLYEVTRGHPDGSTTTERISAMAVVTEDNHIRLLDGGGVILSIHTDHCISVRNISALGEEPDIDFDPAAWENVIATEALRAEGDDDG